MKFRCNHEENRSKVCAVCGSKIVFKNISKSKFVIGENIERSINPQFSLLESRFPNGICLTCKVTMYELNRGKTSRHIPTMPNFLDVQLLRETRNSDDNKCFCFIYRVATRKAHKSPLSGGTGVKRESSTITADNGLYAAKQTVQLKTIEPDQVSGAQLQTPKICKVCFAEVFNERTHR